VFAVHEFTATSNFSSRIESILEPASSPAYRCHAVSKQNQSYQVLAGECTRTELCPLSCVKAGQLVCIKELAGTPEVQARLREMGLGEQQQIKLVSHNSNIICQVCNARLGISEELADSILVQPLPGRLKAA